MKVVVLSDIHSGDAFGLANPANIPKSKTVGRRYAKILFDWYTKKIGEIDKPDIVVCTGELTEGPGRKDTTELWSTDMEEQAEASAELLAMWNADDYRLCYSSMYHRGSEQETDHEVVNYLKLHYNKKADIKSHQRLKVDGVRVDAFHKVGGSSTPQTWASQIAKSATQDIVRGFYREYQPAELYLRGHTHIYGFAGNDRFLAINCPSLKWPFGSYGRNIDRPFYAMGLLEFDISDGEIVEWHPHILRVKLPEEKYAKVG